MNNLINDIADIATGREQVRFEVDIKDEDLTRIILGVSLALGLAISIGVILAKKL